MTFQHFNTFLFCAIHFLIYKMKIVSTIYWRNNLSSHMQSIFVSLHNSAVKHRYEIYSLKLDLGSKNLKYIEMYMKSRVQSTSVNIPGLYRYVTWYLWLILLRCLFNHRQKKSSFHIKLVPALPIWDIVPVKDRLNLNVKLSKILRHCRWR